MTHHLRNLGNQFEISLPKDDEGYLGRECPNKDCEKYFKIKPGTGLIGEHLPCHCPYCGHEGPMDTFHTPSQIEYAKSVMMQKVQKAAVRDMEDMARNFNRKSSGGLIDIKLSVKSSSTSLHHYAEKTLETNVGCVNCTLQYSVYGVFAFCPDCGQHNSLQILLKSLDVVEKMLALVSTNAELAEKLIENALEDSVSAFDSFGRELCRVRAAKSTNPAQAESIRFQNLDGAKTNLTTLFGVDLSAGVTPVEWTDARRGFQKRHLFAHKMGVIDDEYVARADDPSAVVGRKVVVTADDVKAVIKAVRTMAEHLSRSLPQ
jgi:hypothetical protein